MSETAHYRAEKVGENLDVGDRASQGTVLAEFVSTTGQDLCAFELDRQRGAVHVMARDRVRRL